MLRAYLMLSAELGLKGMFVSLGLMTLVLAVGKHLGFSV